MLRVGLEVNAYAVNVADNLGQGSSGCALWGGTCPRGVNYDFYRRDPI